MTTLVRKVAAHIRPLTFVAILGLLATGCQTYQQQNKAVLYWRQGNLTNAVVEAIKMADQNAKNKDAIIWRLEEGAVLRANGQYDDSNKAFDTAEEQIDKYAEAAKVHVGDEAGALLSNQANLNYEGRYYDGIMLDTYKALNYLALGDIEKARPAIIRAYQREQDAVEDNKKRIEKVQEQANTHTNSAAIQKAQSNPKFQTAMQTNYAALDNLKPYADYVNPFTVYLDGLYFMANAADASDLERAHKSFERVGEFIGDNDYIKQDLAAMDNLMNGKPLEPTTYVIFETGCAPVRDQFRIDLPLVYPGLGLASFNAAFPTLKFQDNYVPSLTVSAGTNMLNTAMLCSMDSVIGLDFKNELPLVTTKTLASSITKTITEQLSAQAAGQAGGDFAKLFVQLGGAIYNASVNIADERTWTTLPKEFQFCRIPTPPDRKLEISMPNGLPQTLTLNDGAINLVYVKSINPAMPLLVSQIKLNGSTIFTPSVAATPIKSVEPTPATIPTANPTNESPTTTTPVEPAVNESATNAVVVAAAESATASATTNAPVEPAETKTPEPVEMTATNVPSQPEITTPVSSGDNGTTNTVVAMASEFTMDVPTRVTTNAPVEPVETK
ncbi:MAG TPA: hypothetical protein VE344_01055 [Methylomirabilota bacterium]|nr:hypothetical protein [Methylomirabilota bacterium]